MRLYYTGAAQPAAPQAQPSQSLGGYVSASPVPNELPGNLFTDLSAYGLATGAPDVRCLALRNETSQPVEGLVLALYAGRELPGDETAPDPAELFEYELGVQLPNLDEQQRPYFEDLPQRAGAPFYTTFTTAPIALSAPLPPGGVLGIWMRRRLRPRPVSALPVETSLPPATLAIAWD